MNPVSSSTNCINSIECKDSFTAIKCNVIDSHVEGFNGLYNHKYLLSIFFFFEKKFTKKFENFTHPILTLFSKHIISASEVSCSKLFLIKS